MTLPKIMFINIPLSIEVDWIHGFLFQNEWGWGKYIIRKHPRIKKIFSLKSEKEQVEFLENYIIQFKKDNSKIIEKNKEEYQKAWQRIEKDFFKSLSEIMGINWPKNKKTIKAMVSVNPICPRFLKDWSFSIFYNYKKISYAMEVIMHECCHFLYFEKWRQLYPKMKQEKFESPYIEWHLSEVVAPIILNDKRIQKLLKQKAVFYTEYQKIKINNKFIPEYFAELYERTSEKEDGFQNFLKESYRIIKENKKIFEILK